jgi:hypothetical protein
VAVEEAVAQIARYLSPLVLVAQVVVVLVVRLDKMVRLDQQTQAAVVEVVVVQVVLHMVVAQVDQVSSLLDTQALHKKQRAEL